MFEEKPSVHLETLQLHVVSSITYAGITSMTASLLKLSPLKLCSTSSY